MRPRESCGVSENTVFDVLEPPLELNGTGSPSTELQTDPLALSAKLADAASSIATLSSKPYVTLAELTPLFDVLAAYARRLRGVELRSLASVGSRVAFFLNVHRALSMHAAFVCGPVQWLNDNGEFNASFSNSHLACAYVIGEKSGHRFLFVTAFYGGVELEMPLMSQLNFQKLTLEGLFCLPVRNSAKHSLVGRSSLLVHPFKILLRLLDFVSRSHRPARHG